LVFWILIVVIALTRWITVVIIPVTHRAGLCVCDLGDKAHCGKIFASHIMPALEGGYKSDALGRSALAHIKAISGL
jgi:hypothetical protein